MNRVIAFNYFNKALCDAHIREAREEQCAHLFALQIGVAKFTYTFSVIVLYVHTLE